MVSKAKKLQTENFFHPTCVVHPTAKIGVGNYFGPYCVVGAGVKIGNHNRFEAFCSVGLAPEHKDFWFGDYKSVQIGNSCVVREYVTIHSGTLNDTYLADDIVLLRGSHIGHDSFVSSGVTVSCSVLVGGHSLIFKGANLGLNVVIHQYSVIGHYAMLGMSTVVTKQTAIKPFKTYVGNPARLLKRNLVGIEKNGLTEKYILEAETEYNQASQEKSVTTIQRLLSK